MSAAKSLTLEDNSKQPHQLILIFLRYIGQSL